MPRADYYSGLSLADAIERFVDFHGDPNTRHISGHEIEMLMTAAELLRPRIQGETAA